MASPETPPFAYHHLGFYEGRIVGTVPMAQDMTTWEMHPSGDEFLYLLSGRIACILEDAHGEQVVELRAGAACIVPQGMWHRLLVREPGSLLCMTPGEGTAHRPLSPQGPPPA
jgi:mannose-6-phosphate isomerase-like protein (cupin superfamily)